MDEQTLSLIEALAKLRASSEDFEEIKLAGQKKVRTPEGVEKYDQPIGTIITKDMIEHAAHKAAKAATESLLGKSGSGAAKSSGSSAATPVKKVSAPNADSGSVKNVVGSPGGQTSADIDHFYVSSYVNDPSKANMAWVQKKDGKWYQQNYENGQISSETPLDDTQVNALVAMEKQGLIYTGHISDPEPKNPEQEITEKISGLFDAGKTPQDPEVQKLIQKLQGLSDKAQQDQNVKSGNANSDKTFDITNKSSAPKSTETKKVEQSTTSKTVKINGKDVKVGRYSRPKGFAKAFLLVHEDGTVEYENKTGARKKISHNAFDKHQELGMTKFLTSDTGAIKKDQHFEDGKLVKDSEASAPEAPAAKVEPVKTSSSDTKSAPEAEKPAQEAPKAAPVDSSPKVSSASEPKKAPEVQTPAQNKDSESGTVTIGKLTVKPGRYSRPKGFAKAFLIVHPDGTAEYENKKGERKKIGPKSFEGHWNLGMNKFLTSDTGAMKDGEHFEDGKLVEDNKTPEVKSPETPVESPAVQAAKKAAADLKVKQDQKKDSEDAYVKVQGNTVGPIPAGSKVYRSSYYSSDDASVKYVQEPNGDWWYADKSAVVKVTKGSLAIQSLNNKKKNGALVEEETVKKTPEAPAVPENNADALSVQIHPSKPAYNFPKGSQVYVSDYKQGKDSANVAVVIQPDGKMFRVSVITGKKEVADASDINHYMDSISQGKLVKWDKFHKDDKKNASDDAGLFYVLIGNKPIHPVPVGTKVYHYDGVNQDEASAKFYKDGSGSWHFVNANGDSKANNNLSKNLEDFLNGGHLQEDQVSEKDGKAYVGTVVTPEKTEAEKVVGSGKDLTPPASPTEVKSVKISGMDIKPGKYSIGKGFAKAFLLVHPDGTTEYMNKKGETKKLTPSAFKKNWDAGMNKYAGPLDAAKGPTQAETAPTVAHGLKAGTYYTKQFDSDFDPATSGKLEIMDDGSGVAQVGDSKLTLTPQQVLDSAKYGTMMDEFGNSVIIPGTNPEMVHLFGSTKGFDAKKLDTFRATLVDGKVGILTAMKANAGKLNTGFLLAYGKKYFPGDPEANKKGLIKAIDDALAAKSNKQADKPSVAGLSDPVKYLFEQDQYGYFQKPEIFQKYSADDIHYMSTSEGNKIYRQISESVGGKVMSNPGKMTKYAKYDWYNAFQSGDFSQMYALEKSAGMYMHPEHPGAPANKDTNKITWGAAVKGELPAGKIPEGEWTYDAYSMSDEEIDNYLIAANMAYPTHLSNSDKKYWVKYHMTGKSNGTDKLSLKAKSHAESYPNSPYSKTPVWTDGVKAKKYYDDYIDEGTPVSSWSGKALEQYVKDHPEIVPAKKKGMDPYYLSKEIQNSVDTFKAEKAAKEAAEYAEKMKPKFQKVPGQGVSGGHHEAMVLQDQFGQKWVYKPRTDDQIFLADVEQAAHDLAQIWGYKTAKSFITEFDDRKGHVQQMFDAEKDLNGVSMSDLTTSQVQDLAKEHLLDWALDNDDSWGANLLMLKNGSIVGIDKGRAFVGVGHWNGLSGDSSAHVHMPLVYTDMYNAIASKKISQDDANAAYFAVMKQARKMEKLSDERMAEILEEGFKNRKNWTVGGGPTSKEGAIKAAIERKNSLVSDMEGLWSKVFERAGYEKPEAPKGVISNPDDQDIHLGITPAVIQQAKDNGSYGASAFFAGPEIEDAHLLLYHTKTKSGIDQLNGEMKIREESKAFKDVETWLKANAVKVGNPYDFTPEPMKNELPNASDYYQKIVAGLKTISAHAMDGQYNESTLNGMSWVKNTLQNYVNDFDSKMQDDVTKADMVKQYKDPEAYLAMAQQYLGYIAKAEDHKAQSTKSNPSDFPQFQWTPKKEEKPEPESGVGIKVELRAASSAKAAIEGAPKFEPDGSLKHHLGYTTDGNPGSMYLVTLPTGETIEFRGNTTGTPSASKGLTRFTMPAGANEAASLERIRAQMALMGLNMNEANDDDLELYYWRHLAGIMSAREDSKSGSNDPKYKKFNEAKPVETAKMTPQEELEAWKNAFANITSRKQIDEFVASGGHLPKFGHYHSKDQSKYSGQPYWERFDVTDEQAYSKQLPSGAFYEDSHAEYVVNTGGMLSTEARLRTLGTWKSGMSSSADQSYGSSGFVFIRQNLEPKPGSSDWSMPHIYYSPKILKRTHNYSFAGDNYGNMEYKATQSSFDFDKLTGHTGGSNEVMVKHMVSLLDDIEIVTFTDASLRNKMIEQLKAQGITEIRGVPVEKRFVMRNTKDVISAIKTVKEAWKK